ncbi:DeoR/GlpR family DNA-binding transcription regulator [Salegentibacter sp. F14]|jgi:DeoR family transcriptional regulator of aga operon
MTIAERHKFILNKINKEGFVNVADLSKEMEVTTVTVRKDLKLLEEKGLLYRSHGSATLVSPYVNDRPVNEKNLIQIGEKRGIASKAAELISENEAVIIGSGTTMMALANAIPAKMKLTVLTGAMNVTMALENHPNLEVIQLGGVVRKSSSSVVGHYAEHMLKSFSCSKLFLGVDGISPEYGLTTSNMMEAHLNAAMIKSSLKSIVLTDSTKFGKKGFGKICEIEDVDLIITDAGISKSYKESLEEKGVEVLIAENGS